MPETTSMTTADLRLRVGDWVEVRSAAEILATLDDRARLDALPFMPEMLQYCGGRFRVNRIAHKTCDTIVRPRNRRMTHAVHLEGLNCSGAAHGGCQAECLLFWKEAWLKRGPVPEMEFQVPGNVQPDGGTDAAGLDTGVLDRATRASAAGEPVRYACQATELLRATTDMHWWQPGPYVKDVLSGNFSLSVVVRYILLAVYNNVMRRYWRTRPYTYPYIRGVVSGKTPKEVLNLRPGELVQVRSREEIMQTLDYPQKNRGLSFDVEMVPYCGKTFRVHSRVEQIINERSGEMMQIPGDCIILKGVICGGCLSRNRLFCTRGIYPYWREIWLKRIQ